MCAFVFVWVASLFSKDNWEGTYNEEKKKTCFVNTLLSNKTQALLFIYFLLTFSLQRFKEMKWAMWLPVESSLGQRQKWG